MSTDNDGYARSIEVHTHANVNDISGEGNDESNNYYKSLHLYDDIRLEPENVAMASPIQAMDIEEPCEDTEGNRNGILCTWKKLFFVVVVVLIIVAVGFGALYGLQGATSNKGDNAVPTVTYCPQSITATTTSATATSATVIFLMPVSTDNSGEVFLEYTTNQGQRITVNEIEPDQQGRERLQATFDVGQTFVIVIASDSSGNTNNQCRFTVTVTHGPSTACNSSPCLNGGTCTNTANGYSCSCPSGITGNRCHISGGHPCESNPCPAGQVCLFSPTTYICQITGRKRRDVEGQIELEDINQTMPVPPNHRDLQPPIPRGNFLTNGTVVAAMGVLIIVIVALALLVCRLSPRNRKGIIIAK